jgi:hypothetical protein
MPLFSTVAPIHGFFTQIMLRSDFHSKKFDDKLKNMAPSSNLGEVPDYSQMLNNIPQSLQVTAGTQGISLQTEGTVSFWNFNYSPFLITLPPHLILQAINILILVTCSSVWLFHNTLST